MSQRVSRLAFGGFAAAAMSLAACSSGTSTGSTSNNVPITIGFSASETGAYAVDGKASLQGVEYGVAQANADGGWLGRKIKLTVVDDQSDPTIALEAYTRFITQDHVNLVIGPYSPTLANAVAGIVARYRYVMLDPQDALPVGESGNQWAIQDEPSASQIFDGLPQLAKTKGLSRVALLSINNAYGVACGNANTKRIADNGLDLVYSTSYDATGSFSSVAEKAKSSGAQIVLQCGFFADGVSITRALDQVNYRPTILALSVAPAEPTFASSLGKLASGVIGAAPWWPSLPTPGNKEFISGFSKMFGAPEYHSAVNYASVQALGAAVKKANSLDNGKVLEALKSSEFPTVIGTFKLDSQGKATIGFTYRMFQLQTEGRKLIWPPELAEAPIQVPYGSN